MTTLGSLNLPLITRTLRHSNIWIHTKVLGAGSKLIGIRKLWRIFPIKQKFNNSAAFFTLKNFCAEQNWTVSANLQLSVQHSIRVHNGRKVPGLILIIWNYWISQKAAEVLNFCLIGKILHNFPMPISIEPAPKTFVCIQILLFHRV